MGQNSAVPGCVGFTDQPSILQVRIRICSFATSITLRSCQRRTNYINNDVFFSSQGDGPMCRPEIVLPDQTSTGDFQVRFPCYLKKIVSNLIPLLTLILRVLQYIFLKSHDHIPVLLHAHRQRIFLFFFFFFFNSMKSLSWKSEMDAIPASLAPLVAAISFQMIQWLEYEM